MYSGTTLRTSSGKVLGAHQKIDRVARRALRSIAPTLAFPGIKEILHFEGLNGPDGLKRKSPARDEPWHYYDPMNSEDNDILGMVADHQTNLIKALHTGNNERAAFEAAWMAHAVVDGLTPAHHFPFEETIEKIRGEGIEHRTTVYKKLVYPGKNTRERVKNNWSIWGAGGAMTNHGMFEWGVATTISTIQLKGAYPNANDMIRVKDEGIGPMFKAAAHDIYDLHMYESFSKKGWTRQLARQTRETLAPAIVKIVILAWYDAANQANIKSQNSAKTTKESN